MNQYCIPTEGIFRTILSIMPSSVRVCHVAGGWLPATWDGGLGQPTLDLWWTKWGCKEFFFPRVLWFTPVTIIPLMFPHLRLTVYNL
jgi:hypothetical protein